jgi:cytochrome c553
MPTRVADDHRVTTPRRWISLVAGVITGGAALVVVWFALHHDHAPDPRDLYHEISDESALRTLAGDASIVARGRALFTRNCTLCHGTAGQGSVGPNLRDEYWLKGSDLMRICESIANGNPAKGMAAWSAVMKPDDLHALAAFIASLQGTEDGTGKPPEGTPQPMTWRATR